MKQTRQSRRALLSAVGTVAAGVALSPARPRAQSNGTFTPARHKEDAWFDELPGKHRVIIDAALVGSASMALQYPTNLFVANKNGYGLEDADIATVVCLRHESTIFAFNNAMWAKYGATIAKSSNYTMPNGAEPVVNPMRNIDGLAKRGVHFAVCGLATRRIAGQIATATGAKTDDALKELSENLIPNGHLMAAGVIAITRAQEYGYSLIVAG